MEYNAVINQITFNHETLNFTLGLEIGGDYLQMAIDQEQAKGIISSYERSAKFKVDVRTTGGNTYYIITDKQ